MITSFKPILVDEGLRSTSFVLIFVEAHWCLFRQTLEERFEVVLHLINDKLLHDYIGRIMAALKKNGVFMAITCIAGIFEYGFSTHSGSKSIFRLAFEEVRATQFEQTETASKRPIFSHEALTPSFPQDSRGVMSQASRFAFSCLSIALRRIGDMNVLPLIHVYLVFLESLTRVEEAMTYIERDIPWTEICSFLHALLKLKILTFRIFQNGFPNNNIGRPLPEDFIIRGQIYGQSYFPDAWFNDAVMDDEERMLESSMMTEARIERILWLGYCLASVRLI